MATKARGVSAQTANYTETLVKPFFVAEGNLGRV